MTVAVDKWRVFCQNQLDFLRRLLDNYYYAFVARSISDMLLQPVDKSLRDKLIEAKVICEAFDLWDKFNHQRALELLEPHGSQFYPYIIDLKRILGKSRATGYEMVSDLTYNAERRASQKHYDDAIARLYRATELFAQIRLEKEYGYKTGEMKLEQLPEHLQEAYERHTRDNKLMLGLRDDYELLLKLGDPFGKKYKEKEGSILNALNKRNSSIGAHGKNPLNEEDYHLVKNKLMGFILESANEIGLDMGIKQLPGRGIL